MVSLLRNFAPNYKSTGRSRGQAAGVSGVAASRLFKRAFRRLAAFLWMMPRLAALSSAEMSERMSSAFDFVAARFCNDPRRLKTLRLRRARPGIWRARLAADLVLAMERKFVDGEARGIESRCQAAGGPT